MYIYIYIYMYICTVDMVFSCALYFLFNISTFSVAGSRVDHKTLQKMDGLGYWSAECNHDFI